MSKDRRHTFSKRRCTRFKVVIAKKGKFKGRKVRRCWKWGSK